jgi:maltooligosyltrehalose trehalohydrolase
MAAEVRVRIRDRNVHLVLENDDNTASHLAGDFDAQWNDDGHHVLHALLTGEYQGYYRDYGNNPAALLARCLKEGSCGARSRHRPAAPVSANPAHLHGRRKCERGAVFFLH